MQALRREEHFSKSLYFKVLKRVKSRVKSRIILVRIRRESVVVSHDVFKTDSPTLKICMRGARISHVRVNKPLGPVYTWPTLTGVKLNNN